MSDRVANWESVIHKIVRSNEGNSILVSSEGGRTRYKIPKQIVQGFDGHEVSLHIQKTKLERFKDATGEGFREVKK